VICSCQSGYITEEQNNDQMLTNPEKNQGEALEPFDELLFEVFDVSGTCTIRAYTYEKSSSLDKFYERYILLTTDEDGNNVNKAVFTTIEDGGLGHSYFVASDWMSKSGSNFKQVFFSFPHLQSNHSVGYLSFILAEKPYYYKIKFKQEMPYLLEAAQSNEVESLMNEIIIQLVHEVESKKNFFEKGDGDLMRYCVNNYPHQHNTDITILEHCIQVRKSYFDYQN
jgi:hypothetical protein